MIPLYNRLVTVIPLLFCLSLSAQELTMEDIISMRKLPVDQIDSIVRSKQFAQTKKELLTAKKWNYSGIEEFGVVKPPDSTMKNDNIALMADGTYLKVSSKKPSFEPQH